LARSTHVKKSPKNLLNHLSTLNRPNGRSQPGYKSGLTLHWSPWRCFCLCPSQKTFRHPPMGELFWTSLEALKNGVSAFTLPSNLFHYNSTCKRAKQSWGPFVKLPEAPILRLLMLRRLLLHWGFFRTAGICSYLAAP
jgi:hypothetical protein